MLVVLPSTSYMHGLCLTTESYVFVYFYCLGLRLLPRDHQILVQEGVLNHANLTVPSQMSIPTKVLGHKTSCWRDV